MTENLQIDLKDGDKRSFINRAWWPLLAMILFAGVYYVSYQMLSPAPTDIDSTKILDIFDKYAQYFGFALAILSLLLWYVLYGIKSLLRLGKCSLVNPLTYLLGVVLWGALAYQIYFREPRFTNIGRAIIDYVAAPLWYTCVVLAGVGVVWFLGNLLYVIFKKNK